MGAPGTLIPAEVPSSQLPNPGFDARGFANLLRTPQDVCLVDDEGSRMLAMPPDLETVFAVGSSKAEEASAVGIQTKVTQTERFEDQWDRLLPSLHTSCESSSETSGQASTAQKKKVNDVSEYVISAAKNPAFAQKLHAVLLESGASPPPDLFSNIDAHEQSSLVSGKTADNEVGCGPDRVYSNHGQSLVPYNRVEPLNNVHYDRKQKMSAERLAQPNNKLEKVSFTSDASLPSQPTTEGIFGGGANGQFQTDAAGVNMVALNQAQMAARSLDEGQIHESFFGATADSCKRLDSFPLVNDDKQWFQNMLGIFNDIEVSKESPGKLMEMSNSGFCVASDAHGEGIRPVLWEVAKLEVRWEDLRIGERIGIGKSITIIFVSN